MDATTTEIYDPTAWDLFCSTFRDLPAGIVALLTIGLLALALWAGLKGWPYLRALLVLDSAPAASVASDATGLVRVTGQAFPGNPTPDGFSTPKHVWRETSSYDSGFSHRMARSGSYSVAPIALRDATGECVINPREALVVPGRSESSEDRRMFGGTKWSSERSILTGDSVLAIGILRHRKARPDRPEDLRSSLRRGAGGVLLLSSKTESATRFHLRLRAFPALLVVVLGAGLAVWVFTTHLQAYPNQSLSEYGRALITHPLLSSPGYQ